MYSFIVLTFLKLSNCNFVRKLLGKYQCNTSGIFLVQLIKEEVNNERVYLILLTSWSYCDDKLLLLLV